MWSHNIVRWQIFCFFPTCLKNLLWHQLFVNHDFKHKLLKEFFGTSKCLTKIESIQFYKRLDLPWTSQMSWEDNLSRPCPLPSCFQLSIWNNKLMKMELIFAMHKFTHTETQCTRVEKTLHWRQDFGRLCVLKTKWRAHRPGDGASFHMTSSEHHGMGHQAVPKHQPRRFVHPSLNLVVGHKRRKKAVKKHLPPHQTPVGSHVQSNLGSLV